MGIGSGLYWKSVLYLRHSGTASLTDFCHSKKTFRKSWEMLHFNFNFVFWYQKCQDFLFSWDDPGIFKVQFWDFSFSLLSEMLKIIRRHDKHCMMLWFRTLCFKLLCFRTTLFWKIGQNKTLINLNLGIYSKATVIPNSFFKLLSMRLTDNSTRPARPQTRLARASIPKDKCYSRKDEAN